MDYREKERIVRRICVGKLYNRVSFHNEIIPVIFTDPNCYVLLEADNEYQTYLSELREDGSFFTLEQSFNILKKQGIWTKRLDTELEATLSNIEVIKEQIPRQQFQKKQQEALVKSLKKAKNRVQELYSIKNQLYSCTIEYMAEQALRRFIIPKISLIDEKYHKYWAFPSFSDILCVCYYKDNAIEESIYRELARSDPWRLYWTVSKNSGNNLFPCSAVEMTDLQSRLVFWTKVYDFAYESSNRPSEEIIDDDEKFDIWYKAEADRIDKETKGNRELDVVGDEVFIPADREGAKEVYDLNSPINRAKIQRRLDAVRKKGTVLEADLPDIKQEIEIKTNKMAMDAMTNRSR